MLVFNDLPKLDRLKQFLSVPSRSPSTKKCLSQIPHFETKSLTKLVIDHLMKLKQKFYGYFLCLGKDEFACINNLFIANVQMLQVRTGTQEELVEL